MKTNNINKLGTPKKIFNLKNMTISLKTDFITICSSLLGIVIISLYFLVNGLAENYESRFIEQATENKRQVLSHLMAILENEKVMKNEGSLLIQKNIELSTQAQQVIGAAVIDKNAEKIIFCSDEKFVGNKIDVSDFINSIKKVTSFSGNFIVKENANFLIIYFLNNEKLPSVVLFELQIKIIFICALILCVAISCVLSARIIAPIDSIKNAAKEFSRGNFKYRIPKTKYSELNDMICAYHLMAKNLQSFYKTLEKKVLERTSELERAIAELKSTQSVMVHSEKMKSLGSLVAGVTHEINNPINFIYGNLIHLNNYTQDLMKIIDKYSECDVELHKEKIDEAVALKKDVEYDFLKEDLPSLIQSCREGAERAKNIIQDLKSFSRVDPNIVAVIDLKKEIDATLNILTNKLKNRITIHKKYEQNLPMIEGMAGQLNQVFMNILDNAAYAIKEKGDIYIRLKSNEKYVLIEFEDNGIGMSAETVKKIFEPFYTTKPVGVGTGLGMSISYKVIKTHSGKISVESIEGQGTLFKIALPIKYTPNEEALAGEYDRRQKV